MSIIIKEVETKRDLKKFIEFYVKLYKDSKSFVPPLFLDEYEGLRRDKNPAYEYCDAKFYLAYKDNKIVGRVCALHNKRYNEIWKCKRLRFTRFDFIDDYEVSSALMDKVYDYARELELEEIQGPMGFCDLDKQGMLVEGFDELNMMVTPYNHKYYIQHMEKLGFSKDADWIEFLINIPEQLDEKLIRVNNIVLKRNKLKVLKIKKMKEVLPWAKKIFDLLGDAYKNLYGVIPLTDEQINMYVRQFISFLTPDFVSIILNEDDEPVAIGISMPSIARAVKKTNGHLFPFGFISVLKALKSRRLERVDLLLIGVKPEYQLKGINGIIISEMYKTFHRKKVIYAESSPMLETNEKIQSMWNHFENRQHKRRRCYLKKL